MRDDPMVSRGGQLDSGDNVVALPNLMSGRLADLLAAASGAGQEHELRGELSARADFQAASASWPAPRRKLRRTPAVVAVTTVATMMVATTGLAAATDLPGSAGRAVQGILGTVGVNLSSPGPSASGVDGAAASSGSGAPVDGGNRSVGVASGDCTGGGTGAAGVAAVATTACAITVPRQGSKTVVPASSGAAPRSGNRASAPASTRTFRAPQTKLHSSGGTPTVQGPGTPAGGGTSRGGNSGGTGSCGTTTTTTTTTSTTEPADGSSSTTTTDPSAPASGCGHSGDHHHGGTSTTTTTTP